MRVGRKTIARPRRSAVKPKKRYEVKFDRRFQAQPQKRRRQQSRLDVMTCGDRSLGLRQIHAGSSRHDPPRPGSAAKAVATKTLLRTPTGCPAQARSKRRANKSTRRSCWWINRRSAGRRVRIPVTYTEAPSTAIRELFSVNWSKPQSPQLHSRGVLLVQRPGGALRNLPGRRHVITVEMQFLAGRRTRVRRYAKAGNAIAREILESRSTKDKNIAPSAAR